MVKKEEKTGITNKQITIVLILLIGFYTVGYIQGESEKEEYKGYTSLTECADDLEKVYYYYEERGILLNRTMKTGYDCFEMLEACNQEIQALKRG